MYDYIPMKFNFDYKKSSGRFDHYYVEAVTEERQEFRVAWAGETDFFMDDYSIRSLVSSMEHGSLINGMTLSALQDAYYNVSDDNAMIDISELL